MHVANTEHLKQYFPIASGVALFVVFSIVCVAQFLASHSVAQESTNTHRMYFEARLIPEGVSVEKGLEWRIFGPKINETGKLPMLAEAQGGSRSFKMSAGQYLVHVAYGNASAVRKIVVETENQREVFILDAGGLELSAIAGIGTPISRNLLRFDIYSSEVDTRGERRIIARRILPGQIVPFQAGTYHVVSKFGNLNAEIRADIRVRAGKVTKAQLKHRAARITLRLVRSLGGDALANTQWSVINESGDLITESTSAFPRIVLSEGTYTAVAKNGERTYSEDFTVRPGFNRDVELLVAG